ncbi:MAG: O-antigen ligase family protein [Chloroflexi bacterium]|nr:O-antigen ligase family protein [Chloroflexota bacterium]
MIRQFVSGSKKWMTWFAIAAILASGFLAVFSQWIIAVIEQRGYPAWVSLAFLTGCILLVGVGFTAYEVLVWLCFSLIGFVRIEPAPFDYLVLAVMAIGWARGKLGLFNVRQNVLVLSGLWVFLLANLISMVGVAAQPASWRFMLITFYLLVLFLFVRLYGQNQKAIKVLLAGYLVSATVNAVLVILGLFGLGFASSMVGWSIRGVGFFKDPNVFGAYIASAAMIAMDRIVQSKGRWYRVMGYGILAFLLGFTAVYSLSRAVWVSLVLSIGIYAWLLARKAPRSAAIVVSVLLVLAISAVFFLQSSQMAAFVTGHMRLQDYDLARFGNQYQGLIAGLSQPLGLGPAGWPNAHSLYVKTLAEHGLLGLVSLGMVIVGSIWPLVGRIAVADDSRSALSAQVLLAILIGQLVNSVVIDSIHWRHLWVLLGIAWAFSDGSGAKQGEEDG